MSAGSLAAEFTAVGLWRWVHDFQVPEGAESVMFNPEEIGNIAGHEQSLWWFRGMRHIAFRLLDPVAQGNQIRRVFEGGCGTGHFASLVSQRYHVPVFGVDLDPSAARLCRHRPGVECARGDLSALPFPAESFDLVLAMDVLIHLREGEETAAFRELLRILRPGGFVFLRTSALGIFRSRHSEFIWEQQRFSKKSLRRLALAEGVEIHRLCYANFLLSPLALLKFRVWEPLTRQAPSSGVAPLAAPLEMCFHGALRLESALIGRGFDAPFGQSLYLLATKKKV
jgi:SAM-dependent methyltransferase